MMTQTCEALPLYWGMVPEDKAEDVGKVHLETHIAEGISYEIDESNLRADKRTIEKI